MTDTNKVAGELRVLADRARWLPPPNHRKPEQFHEARDELAHDLMLLAERIALGKP